MAQPGGDSDKPRHADPRVMISDAEAGASRLRHASSQAEGRWTLLLATLLFCSLIAVIQKFQWWENGAGVVALVAFWLLAAVTGWRRSATQTIRPKHYSAVWRASGLWAGLGLAASYFVLRSPDGEISLWSSFLAAGVSTAPIFACGVWLLVRRH